MTRIGIDLGTTYSCVSYLDENGKPVISPDAEDCTNTPSVILFRDRDSVIVGTEAKETSALFDPEYTVESIKRMVGTDYKVSIYDRTYDPVSLSSIILRKLLDDFELKHGTRPTEAVITCPAYFKNNERMATKDAGYSAGLKEVTLLNEPTAAAICFGFGQDDNSHKRILVYDLGGGTFDVTILDINGRHFDVVATDGERKLGGKDWDERIKEMILDKLSQISGIQIGSMKKNTDLMARLTMDSENIKKRLTDNEKANMTCVIKGSKYKYTITRQEFEDATFDLVTTTADIVDRALASKNITEDEIDEIVLVGGSSLMPQVTETIKNRYPNNRISIYDPHESIAKGAAIFSASLDSVTSDETESTHDAAAEENPKTGEPAITINDVLSSSFGIMAKVCGQDMITNIIFKNNPLPITRERMYYLQEDGQDELEIEIYESSANDDNAGKNIPLDEGTNLGKFIMSLPLGVTRETPVKITFNATKEGILTATATCMDAVCSCRIERKLTG